MTYKFPAFYCLKTLLGFGGEQDLNQITLYGPGLEFELYKMGEARSADASERCNRLAARLTKAWEERAGLQITEEERG